VTDRMASGRMPRLVHDEAPTRGSARGAARRDLIAKIHVGKKQLAMEDVSYRALLQRIAGVTSAADATLQGLDLVLKEFRRLGFAAQKRRPDHRGQMRKIEALWAELAPYRRREGPHGDAESETALQAFVLRQTGKDDHRFLNAEQANKVIEGLKGWLARVRREQAV